MLEEERHKEENLRHESRRHWDARAFDESIIPNFRIMKKLT